MTLGSNFSSIRGKVEKGYYVASVLIGYVILEKDYSIF